MNTAGFVIILSYTNSLRKKRNFCIKKAADDIQGEESKFIGNKSQLMPVERTAPLAVRKQLSFMLKVSFKVLQSEKQKGVREVLIEK